MLARSAPGETRIMRRQEVVDLLEFGGVVAQVVNLVDKERLHPVPVQKQAHQVDQSVASVQSIRGDVERILGTRPQLAEHDGLAGPQQSDERDKSSARSMLELLKQEPGQRVPTGVPDSKCIAVQNMVRIH